jgi:hypothetical protein
MNVIQKQRMKKKMILKVWTKIARISKVKNNLKLSRKRNMKMKLILMRSKAFLLTATIKKC